MARCRPAETDRSYHDSARRPLSPNSEVTLSGYVNSRVQRGTEASLREAALLSPTHAPAHALLAQRRLRADPSDSPSGLAEADWHSRYAASLAPADPRVQSIRATVLRSMPTHTNRESQGRGAR